MIGNLPKQLEVAGKWYEIRTDYRDCLMILQAFKDPELNQQEKYQVLLQILYRDEIPSDIEEGIKKGVWFLDCGNTISEPKQKKPLMDFEQDEQMLFSAVNKVAGYETRAIEYLHFWTFMSFFNEIGEGLFSTVLGIRQKKAKGKNLEPHEKEFYRNNKEMIDLKERYTEKEKIEKEKLNQLFS